MRYLKNVYQFLTKPRIEWLSVYDKIYKYLNVHYNFLLLKSLFLKKVYSYE